MCNFIIVMEVFPLFRLSKSKKNIHILDTTEIIK